MFRTVHQTHRQVCRVNLNLEQEVVLLLVKQGFPRGILPLVSLDVHKTSENIRPILYGFLGGREEGG